MNLIALKPYVRHLKAHKFVPQGCFSFNKSDLKDENIILSLRHFLGLIAGETTTGYRASPMKPTRPAMIAVFFVQIFDRCAIFKREWWLPLAQTEELYSLHAKQSKTNTNLLLSQKISCKVLNHSLSILSISFSGNAILLLYSLSAFCR